MKRDDVLARLAALADPEYLKGMEKFALPAERTLGVPLPALRQLAREIGTDHVLARALWEEGFREARILATLVDDPAGVTGEQMEAWAREFNSWEICDQCCQNLFAASPHAWKKAEEWAIREEEFVKRAGFVLIAKLARNRKSAKDDCFFRFFPLIRAEAHDRRNFVKKAVSWALREIGKRNERCREAAVALAKDLIASESLTARWIGRDTLQDLR